MPGSNSPNDAATPTRQGPSTMAALAEQVLAEDADRVALLDEIAARLTAPQPAGYLLRRARNLTASPHFEEAFGAFVAAARPTFANSATTDPDLAGATRDELYEMAKQSEIPGRSHMTKQELSDALREQA